MYRYGLLIFLLNFGSDVSASTSKSLDKLLELGTEFLSKGRYQDALQYFHEAIEKDPENYVAYYKRGTSFLILGKARQALSDFDKVLEFKRDWTSVRIERGNVYLKNGDLEEAEDDFNVVLADDPYNSAAINGLHNVNLAREYIASLENFYYQQDYESAMSILRDAIEVCPWSPRLRKLRAECHLKLGDALAAVSDLKSTAKLAVDDTKGYLELSNLLYDLGLVKDSLEEIKHCLKLDPEHPECFKFYKKIKKVSKFVQDAEEALESSRLPDCIQKANNVLKLETSTNTVRLIALKLLCKAYTAQSETDNAIKNCQEVLKIQKDAETLCDSAEAYLAADMFDDAIIDYKEALKIDANNHRAEEGLQKAKQRQKQSETRDYYKILGVPRNAKKQQIVKAYRKAAQQWHPDNFPDPEKKKHAQKKFIDIAAAKEVLTDEQKRAEFDAGRDPLDPESGKHQQGFNPFHEFHQGSPFHFKFHFN